MIDNTRNGTGGKFRELKAHPLEDGRIIVYRIIPAEPYKGQQKYKRREGAEYLIFSSKQKRLWWRDIREDNGFGIPEVAIKATPKEWIDRATSADRRVSDDDFDFGELIALLGSLK